MGRIYSTAKTPATAQCAICEHPLAKRAGQSYPPYLCAECDTQWADKSGEPWLAFLINSEKARRRVKLREVDEGYTDAI